VRLYPFNLKVFFLPTAFANQNRAAGFKQRQRFRIRTDFVGAFNAMRPNDLADEDMIFVFHRPIQLIEYFRLQIEYLWNPIELEKTERGDLSNIQFSITAQLN
jgi:hypothetical protein